MIKPNLYGYQRAALDKLKCGSILCGGVGSGKSRTALAWYYICNGGELGDEFLPMDKEAPDLYIITTAKKRDSAEWEMEFIPFLFNTEMYSSKVIVDSWNNIGKYIAVKDCYFIFDEQRVVGSGAWVKSFLKIARNNIWILLSATPGDTWSDYIPVFVANGFYKNRSEFIREHIIYKKFLTYPAIDRYICTKKLEFLRNKVLVPMDYKKKTYRNHKKVVCNYDILACKQVMKTRTNPFTGEPIINAAELCYTLRKIVNSDPSRIEKVIEIAKNHPKIIIFYNFDYELDELVAANYGSDVVVAQWNGHKHEKIPSKSKKWVYLVQYTAGAEGWNCIETDTVIFFSQNYSYKTMEQASGRIDRANTPFDILNYYHLMSTSKIDLAISEALSHKKKFNERKFGENNGK